MIGEMTVSVWCPKCQKSLDVPDRADLEWFMATHAWDTHSVFDETSSVSDRPVFCVECKLWLRSDDLFVGAADLVHHLISVHHWATGEVSA